MSNISKPRQGSKLSPHAALDFQTAHALTVLARKPIPGDIIHSDSDSDDFSIEEILCSNIVSDLSEKYKFFKTEDATAICQVETAKEYFYTELHDPVFSHIIELHGLLIGIELDKEYVELVTHTLTTNTLICCPLIDQDELEFLIPGGC